MTEPKIAQEKTSLVIDKRDNVAVALKDLKKGEEYKVDITEKVSKVVTLHHDIPFGHKFAIHEIEENESVLKYGEEIGKMKEKVRIGEWIHNHNMYCDRGMK